MNLLVTCDANYLHPLSVMLYSLSMTHDTPVSIYLVHTKITNDDIDLMKAYVDYISDGKFLLNDIRIEEVFENASTSLLYESIEMYYRLLAHRFLPENIERVLYLDPDILVINSLEDLYQIDFEEKLIAACLHEAPLIQSFNSARLSLTSEEEIREYYNSGVLMMNLAAIREEPRDNEIIKYAEETTKLGSIMPDQDLLNVVFKDDIKPLPEIKYNYDARNTNFYKLSHNFRSMDKVMDETSIIHFNGKNKPWNDNYVGRFGILFKFIEKRAVLAMSRIKKDRVKK